MKVNKLYYGNLVIEICAINNIFKYCIRNREKLIYEDHREFPNIDECKNRAIGWIDDHDIYNILID